MSKPWDEKPLWWKCYMGASQKAYMHAGHLIGHLGTTPFAFYDAAKLLPCYNKAQFEKAVNDLTVYTARVGSPPRYELTEHAKKVLWIIIGPGPDHPEYQQWWKGRMISVNLMRAEGKEPEFAYTPPVPLPEEKPAEPEPAKKRTRKKAG